MSSTSTAQRSTGELLVTDPVPIPFRVNVVDPAGMVLGNATDIIRNGFDHWLPLIDKLGVLSGKGKDDLALPRSLCPRST